MTGWSIMSSEERTQTLRWRRRKDARPVEILTAALACFAERGVNLTRLDSRPMLGRPFEYRFYVDFSINGEASSAAAAEAALNDLEEASAEIKLFGTYPAA